MPDIILPNTGVTKPQVGASRDTWGSKTNVNWDIVDDIFKPDGTGQGVGLHIGADKTLKVDGAFNLAPGATIPGGNLANASVPLAKIENINSDRVIGRATAGAGAPEQIICTAQARSLLDDSTAAEQRATLQAAGIGSNTFTGDQIVQSVDGGAAQGPLLALDRASASPAVDDLLGVLELRGRNDATTLRTYAAILAQIKDAAAGSEDGLLLLQSIVAGALATRFSVGQGFFAPGLADKGPGTVNATAYFQNDTALQLFLRGHIDGFVMNNDSGDLNNDIRIASGQATADSNDYLLERTSNIVKRLDAVWAVGNDAGGLDTGSKAANTWYHVFVIARPDTGVVDVLFSASLAPTLPTNYTKKRRIGSIKTSSGNNILAFTQVGPEFEWVTPIVDFDAGPGAGVNNVSLNGVPNGLRVMARIVPGYRLGTGISAQTLDVHSRDAADQTPHDPATSGLSTGAAIISPGVTLQWTFGGEQWLITDNSQRIQLRSTDISGGTRAGIVTRGWRDFRGRDA